MEAVEPVVRYSPEVALIHRKLSLTIGFSAKKAYPVCQVDFHSDGAAQSFVRRLAHRWGLRHGLAPCDGRYVVQHHQISRTDVSVVNFSGKPWAYPPFAGVLLYLRYCAFGSAGLSWDYHRGTRSCPWLLPVLLLFCNCGFTVAISGTAAPREHRKRGLPRLYG